MFKLTNVKYKDVLKIDSLEINEKEVTCIIGKSGGGKSTFLKLLNNMVSSDKGKITFNNKDVNEYNPVELRRRVLMLPQNPIIFSGKIKDNFNLTMYYNDLDNLPDEKYTKILKKVGLYNKKLSDSVENLSGGEKQRLALARILLLDPDILLLDEPSSALDEQTEKIIIKMIVNCIKEKNGTLVMVTHSKEIAEQYGDTIISIKDGRIYNINKGRVTSID